MKKLMVLFIMVAMVMGFSFSVMAVPTMPDLDGDLGPETLNVRALIAPYANVSVTVDDSIFVDPEQDDMTEMWLTPEEGIYANDGTIFGNMLNQAFPGIDIVHTGQSKPGSESNLATILVETNTPIFIDYQWLPGDTWMKNVDTILAIHERNHSPAEDEDGEYGGAAGMTDFAYNQAKVAAIFTDVSNLGGYVGAFGETSFGAAVTLEDNFSVLQNYQHCTTRKYELVAGFKLDKLTHVRAGQYDAEVEVTLSELPTIH